MSLIERKAAAMAGAMHYEGTLCKRCRATLRYTSNGKCVACTRRARLVAETEIRNVLNHVRGK